MKKVFAIALITLSLSSCGFGGKPKVFDEHKYTLIDVKNAVEKIGLKCDAWKPITLSIEGSAICRKQLFFLSFFLDYKNDSERDMLIRRKAQQESDYQKLPSTYGSTVVIFGDKEEIRKIADEFNWPVIDAPN